MKGSNRNSHALGDFLLQFHPTTVNFQKQPQYVVKIYLEKNVQVIGQIQQAIRMPPSTLKYNFDPELKPIEFRALSFKHCDYTVSLYEVLGDNRESWIAGTSINISSFLRGYEEEFRKNDERLQIELRENVGKSIPELWRGLNNNFQRKQLEHTLHFPSIKASLDFKVVPISRHDEAVALDDSEAVKQKDKFPKGDIWRSSTLPIGKKHFSSIKLTKKEDSNISDIDDGLTFKYPPQCMEEHKQVVKKEFKKFSEKMTNNLMNIPEQEEVTMPNRGQKGIPKSDIIGRFEFDDMEIDERFEDEELKEIGALPTRAKEEEPDAGEQEKDFSSFNRISNEQSITIGRFREILSPQNNATSQLGILSSVPNAPFRESVQMKESPSKWSECLLTAIMILISGLLLAYLMHPLSKTD